MDSETSPLFFTYIIQSTTTAQFFVGSCSDLLKQFHDHQCGQCRDTRGRGPWWLPYYEIYESHAEAQDRENDIKHKKSSRYIRTIIYKEFPLIELY